MKPRTLSFFFLTGITSIFVAFAFLKGGVHPSEFVAPRLVILYTTCTLNRDFLEPYHSGIRYTPNFKDFAQHSYVFTRHQSEVGFSGASYAVLFTGKHMYNTGIYYHPAFLKDNNYLIAEAFRDNGYETFFWSGMSMASPHLNYGQGVKSENISYDSPVDFKTLSKNDHAFISILKRIKSDPKYKAFIEINFTMTHAPYSQYSNIKETQSFCRKFPEECKGVTDQDIAAYLPIHEKNFGDLSFHFNHAIQALNLTKNDIQTMARVLEITYKSCVHRLDYTFGNTIDALKESDISNTTLVAFTADHGEIFYREDYPIKWGHWGLAPEVLNVPLMIRIGGGLAHSKHYTQASSSVDVFPTIAGLSNLRISKNYKLDGQDLSRSLVGEKAIADRVIFSTQGLPHPADVVADVKMMPVEARSEDMIYRIEPRPNRPLNIELFQLEGNSEERTSQKLPIQNHIVDLLDQYRTRLIHGYIAWADQSDREEVLERLRSLGYLH